MNIKDLTKEIPYKWREQSVNAQGATMVAYIDARQLFDTLDEVVGADKWQSDYKIINNNLFAGIGINVDGKGWVWKWDVGTESNVDKEKGEASDAIKRAGVQWGVGRFLYSLGIVKLKSADYKGKFKPADDNGSIIWDKEKLSVLCNQSIKEGNLDRTKLKVVSTPQQKIVLTPIKLDERKQKALTAFKKLDGAKVIKYLTANKLMYATVEDFIAKESIEKVLEVYDKVK